MEPVELAQDALKGRGGVVIHGSVGESCHELLPRFGKPEMVTRDVLSGQRRTKVATELLGRLEEWKAFGRAVGLSRRLVHRSRAIPAARDSSGRCPAIDRATGVLTPPDGHVRPY